MNEGDFRLDFFMRICVDRIHTPSLREMLDAAPGERRGLVHHIAEKAAGPDEADELTAEVEAWIDAKLAPDYAWPGNVRELEQCVRRRLVHHSCRPVELVLAPPAAEEEGRGGGGGGGGRRARTRRGGRGGRQGRQGFHPRFPQR